MKISLLFVAVFISILTACTVPVDGAVPAQKSVDVPVPVVPTLVGLAQSNVVCDLCSPELLAAKTQGIHDAMTLVVQYTGADIRPEHSPATFHLSDDAMCGQYNAGTTGFCGAVSNGKAQMCLFDVEKQNRSLPFTPANAVTIQDQLLPIHEAMHAWFLGRVKNYLIEEPFCKFTSFVISKDPMYADPCSFFIDSPKSPDQLMHNLCALGMDKDSVSETLRRTGASADDKNRLLTTEEFSEIVTDVLGKDSRPAFQSTGLLP